MIAVMLEPWADRDLWVLEATLGNPQVMQHLGGIETAEQIVARHGRYLNRSDCGGMFTIRIDEGGVVAGSIGFWEKQWRGEAVYETGWMVLPEFAGRGIATQAALRVMELAKEEGAHRFMHAFPSVNNLPSNAVCRKAGFTNLGAYTFEYPKGHFMQCNDWRIDLLA